MTELIFGQVQSFRAELWVHTSRAWAGVVQATLELPTKGRDNWSFDLHTTIEVIAPSDGHATLYIMTHDGKHVATQRFPDASRVRAGDIIRVEGTYPANHKEINVNEQDQEFADKIGKAVNEFNKLTAEANKQGLRVSLSVQPYNRVGLAPAEILSAEVTRVVTPRKETPKWEG